MSFWIKGFASGESLDDGSISSRYGFAARGPDPCDPLQPLEVDERARAADDLGRAERQHELLRRLERRHADEPGPNPLEHVCVGACAHREVVLAPEPERLVVVRLEEKAR